jgi:hypothetical protein
MPFNKARSKLSATRTAALDGLLAAWRGASDIPPQAAANLQAERGSEIDPLAEYLRELADSHDQLGVEPPGPRAEFERVGRIFAFAGHDAMPYRSAVLGRAVLLEKYARYLTLKLDELGCLDTEDEICINLRLIRDIPEETAKPYFQVYFKAMRLTPLGRGAVFATFAKPVRPGERPWKSPIPDAYTVRDTVALGEDPVGKDYILFAYGVPGSTRLQVPTTASPGWSYQRWFRPSPTADTERHGWTAPIKPGLPKRPEVVHPEIDGTTLVFPIHIASA